MYSKNLYKNKVMREIEEDVRMKGWRPVLLSHGPGYRYEPHQHMEEKLLVVLEGEMKVRAGKDWYVLKPGDELIISGNVEHEATCGSSGCDFFWAERR